MGNSKETYQLLAMHNSDSLSETPELLTTAVNTTARKKKLKRKQRFQSLQRSNSSETRCKCNTRNFVICVASALVICWLIITVWLGFVLHSEIRRLDSNVQNVAASNQNALQEFQHWHTKEKELDGNQTALYSKISVLSQQLTNITSKVDSIATGLAKVEEKLKASPELVNVASLETSVAKIGSQIQGVDSTTKQLKEDTIKLKESVQTFQLNITSLTQKISEIEKAPKAPTSVPESDSLTSLQATVNAIQTNLSQIDKTLTEKIKWAQEDEARDSKYIQALQEARFNISARVETIMKELDERNSEFSTLNSTVVQFSSKMEGAIFKLTNQLSEMEGRCTRLQNSTAHIESTVNALKNAIYTETATDVPPETSKGNTNLTETQLN